MGKYVLEIGNKEYTAELTGISTEEATIVVDGSEYKVKLKEFGRRKQAVSISVPQARPAAPAAPAPAPVKMERSSVGAEPGGGEGAIFAPLPGLILEIQVNPGDTVKAGQTLIVMEAMKMENQVQSTHDGTVKQIFVNKGDNVAEGDALVEIDRPLMTSI